MDLLPPRGWARATTLAAAIALAHFPARGFAQIHLGRPVATDAAQLAQTLDRINRVRTRAGLAGFEPDRDLAEAASGHARYVATMRTVAHVQTESGSAAFSGRTPDDRIGTTGRRFARTAELVSRVLGRDTDSAVDLLLSGVYHRLGLLRSDLSMAGLAIRDRAGQRYLVVNTAGGTVADDTPALTVWPPDDHEAVPAAFDSDSEIPDPVADLNKVGYPVSIQTLPGRILRVTRFELIHRDTGRPVVARLHDRAGDPNTPEWAAFLVPTAPLERAATYVARFVGTIDGSPQTLEWRFRTAPVSLRALDASDERDRAMRLEVAGLDPSESFAVCVSTPAAHAIVRFETTTRFVVESTAAMRCGSQDCPVTVVVSHDLACRTPIVATTIRLRDAVRPR